MRVSEDSVLVRRDTSVSTVTSVTWDTTGLTTTTASVNVSDIYCTDIVVIIVVEYISPTQNC